MMKFTVNTKLSSPSKNKGISISQKSVPQTETKQIGAIFKNMKQGTYVNKGCSSCSGAR